MAGRRCHIRALRGELTPPPPDEAPTEERSKSANTGRRRLDPMLDLQLVVGGKGKPIFGIGATRVTVPPLVGLSASASSSLLFATARGDGEGGASTSGSARSSAAQSASGGRLDARLDRQGWEAAIATVAFVAASAAAWVGVADATGNAPDRAGGAGAGAAASG